MKSRLNGTGTADPEPVARTAFAVSPSEVAPRQLALIDEALVRFTGRRIVASNEVTDLLLDLRSQILLDAALAELEATK